MSRAQIIATLKANLMAAIAGLLEITTRPAFGYLDYPERNIFFLLITEDNNLDIRALC
jgi:hypothetical protein